MAFVGQHKGRVDSAIAAELEKRLQDVTVISPHLVPILTAIQELSVGGKRLRAVLVMLGYQLAGGMESVETVKAGVAMELFHFGILVHDDVMDRDSLRRGVTTIHARFDNLHFGESMAVCAGDFTYGWCIEILSGLHLPAERLNQAIQLWGSYFTRLGYGQILDLSTEQRKEVSEEEILQVLSIKSGEYSCMLPLTLGATLGGADENLIIKLEKYAMELGWVFQLRDDWLAEYGDSEKTGKPVGNDSREGKKTFVTMYGKEKTEAAIREHWEAGKKLAGGNPVLEGLLEWVATRES